MEYVCKVGTPSGEVIERPFTATDEAALRSELEQQGYYIFSIRRGIGLRDLSLRAPRIKPHLLLLFSQEMAALLKAGLPLYQSLDVMLERQQDVVFKRSLTTVREKVKSGTSLSDAMKAEGDLYPPIFSASLVAGERSGSLETVLRRFSQYLRLNQSLRKKAIAATVYPVVILCLMVVMVAVMMVKVIPQFEDFYAGLNVQLPLSTRAIMAVSRALSHNIVWVLLGLVGAGVALAAWLRREGSYLFIDRVLLRVPYLGDLMRMFATSQLARTLSTLLAGGLPLLNALEVAGASIGNRAMAAAVTSVVPQIREGKSLTTALESTGMLDSVALELVKVGEQTGGLGDMLTAVAEFYDEELESRMATVLALAEPVLLVVMAFLVGGMVLAFYLPMFEAISAVQGTR